MSSMYILREYGFIIFFLSNAFDAVFILYVHVTLIVHTVLFSICVVCDVILTRNDTRTKDAGIIIFIQDVFVSLRTVNSGSINSNRAF